jgi:hypothetical protein
LEYKKWCHHVLLVNLKKIRYRYAHFVGSPNEVCFSQF